MKKMKNIKGKIENNKLNEIMERNKRARESRAQAYAKHHKTHHKHSLHDAHAAYHVHHAHANARHQKHGETKHQVHPNISHEQLNHKHEMPKQKKENEKAKKIRRYLISVVVVSLAIGLISIFFTKSLKISGIVILIVFALINTYFIARELLKKSAKIKKMEDVFPDFIELMASNLRAGMTIDKAMLLSSRKEFSPLDEEILILGKDIMTGKELTQALIEMGRKIKSEKIIKTINVINSGIRSGGNLAILLEQTATNMRERNFVEKRAASNVLMYVIFIFFAVAIGAPLLFSLSTVLVQVLTTILADIPSIDTSINLPIALTGVSISTRFILYFAIIFITVIDILASFLLGLVSKGEEKQGFKYMAPLTALSITIFFVIRSFLNSYFEGII